MVEIISFALRKLIEVVGCCKVTKGNLGKTLAAVSYDKLLYAQQPAVSI